LPETLKLRQILDLTEKEDIEWAAETKPLLNYLKKRFGLINQGAFFKRLISGFLILVE
jgi:hypothetical protein